MSCTHGMRSWQYSSMCYPGILQEDNTQWGWWIGKLADEMFPLLSRMSEVPRAIQSKVSVPVDYTIVAPVAWCHSLSTLLLCHPSLARFTLAMSFFLRDNATQCHYLPQVPGMFSTALVGQSASTSQAEVVVNQLVNCCNACDMQCLEIIAPISIWEVWNCKARKQSAPFLEPNGAAFYKCAHQLNGTYRAMLGSLTASST